MKIDNFVALIIISVLTYGLCEQNSTDEISTKQELSLEDDGLIQHKDKQNEDHISLKQQNIEQNSNDTSIINSTTEIEEKKTHTTEVNGYELMNTPEEPYTTNKIGTTKATPDETDISEYSQKLLDKNITEAFTSSTNIIDTSKTTTELQEIYSKTSTLSEILTNYNTESLYTDSKTMVESRKIDHLKETTDQKQDEFKNHTDNSIDENKKTGEIQTKNNEKDEKHSKSSTTGTTVLIFLVIVVILAGAGCFGYKRCKNRDETTKENTDTELEEIKTEHGGVKQVQPTTSVETKPLLKSSTEPNKDNNETSNEQKCNENTPCNGKNNK